MWKFLLYESIHKESSNREEGDLVYYSKKKPNI